MTAFVQKFEKPDVLSAGFYIFDTYGKGVSEESNHSHEEGCDLCLMQSFRVAINTACILQLGFVFVGSQEG